MARGVANTYSFLLSHSLEACSALLADLGFTRLEAMIGPGHLWPEDLDAAGRARLRRHLGRIGMELVTLNQPNLDLNLASLDGAMRAHSERRFADALRLAADLGCPRVVVGPGKPNPLLPAPRERLEGLLAGPLERLLRMGERLGVAVLLENMPFAFLPRLADLIALHRRVGGFGVVYDVANAWFVGEDPAAGLAEGAGLIEVVHVSDTGRDRYAHAPIGAGDVPWREAGRAFAALADRVPLVAEIISESPSKDLADAFRALHGLGWPVEVPDRAGGGA
jgi:sugar phosphate isomerase/epimerase